MKKFVSGVLLVALSAAPAIPVFAVEEVGLGKVEKQKIVYPAASAKKKETLTINNERVMQEIIERQREKDLEDIENLWKGTVENNPVIGFALKKLSSPESAKRIHSSLMAKTLSAMVAGASFVPMMMGGNYATQTGSFAAGRVAQGQRCPEFTTLFLVKPGKRRR